MEGHLCISSLCLVLSKCKGQGLSWDLSPVSHSLRFHRPHRSSASAFPFVLSWHDSSLVNVIL